MPTGASMVVQIRKALMRLDLKAFLKMFEEEEKVTYYRHIV